MSMRVWCDEDGGWWIDTPELGRSALRVRRLVAQGPAVPVEQAAGRGALRWGPDQRSHTDQQLDATMLHRYNAVVTGEAFCATDFTEVPR
ncbi:hypothetical protein ACE1SV_42770 [Streptomyces sennicomposti]